MSTKTFTKVVEESTKKSQNMTLNHTCLRVKDPKRSIDFYTKNFGMKLLEHKKFPDMKFDLYFLGFPNDKKTTKGNHDPNAVVKDESNFFNVSGILELTHNYGTEEDPEFQVNNGNVEPYRGFGHVCFTCFDIDQECGRLEQNGVEFKKRLVDGRQKDIAFVYDPDHYWIELVCYGNRTNHVEEKEPEITKDIGFKFNHTMLRVKDPKPTIEFYTNVLGMTMIDSKHHENAKFSVYFFAYDDGNNNNNSNNYSDSNKNEKIPRRSREGVLEFTHNWGTETDADFQYHNGNDKPQGYGHVCISLKDPKSMCEEICSKYSDDEIKWGVKFNQGKMKNLAFIKDPDNYAIEIIPHGLQV